MTVNGPSPIGGSGYHPIEGLEGIVAEADKVEAAAQEEPGKLEQAVEKADIVDTALGALTQLAEKGLTKEAGTAPLPKVRAGEEGLGIAGEALEGLGTAFAAGKAVKMVREMAPLSARIQELKAKDQLTAPEQAELEKTQAARRKMGFDYGATTTKQGLGAARNITQHTAKYAHVGRHMLHNLKLASKHLGFAGIFVSSGASIADLRETYRLGPVLTEQLTQLKEAVDNTDDPTVQDILTARIAFILQAQSDRLVNMGMSLANVGSALVTAAKLAGVAVAFTGVGAAVVSGALAAAGISYQLYRNREVIPAAARTIKATVVLGYTKGKVKRAEARQTKAVKKSQTVEKRALGTQDRLNLIARKYAQGITRRAHLLAKLEAESPEMQLKNRETMIGLRKEIDAGKVQFQTLSAVIEAKQSILDAKQTRLVSTAKKAAAVVAERKPQIEGFERVKKEHTQELEDAKSARSLKGMSGKDLAAFRTALEPLFAGDEGLAAKEALKTSLAELGQELTEDKPFVVQAIAFILTPVSA